MVTSAVVKSTVKVALKGKWLKAIICGLVPFFVWLIIVLLSDVISQAAGDTAGMVLNILLCVFMLAPLILGTFRFFWRLLCDADDNCIIIFHYFSSRQLYFRAMRLTLALILRAVLFGAVLFLPSAIVDLFSGTWIYDMLQMPIPMWVSNLWMVSVFLKAVAAILLFFVMLRYYMAPMLIVSDENMETAEAIHMSAEISKTTSLEFLLLILSVIGWVILSAFFIPVFFTFPYFIALYLVHCRFCVAYYNNRIKLHTQSDIPTFAAGI